MWLLRQSLLRQSLLRLQLRLLLLKLLLLRMLLRRLLRRLLLSSSLVSNGVHEAQGIEEAGYAKQASVDPTPLAQADWLEQSHRSARKETR